MSSKLMTAGIFGATGVALGALGAHYLKGHVTAGRLSADSLSAFETGVRFHIFHAIVLLAIALYTAHHESKNLNRAFILIVAGIVLFSGSIYLLSTRTLLGAEWLRFLGPVTPLGGVALIAGWIVAGTGNKKS
jgi:uncharacterized membrane protein YgdD (TMEM256/DUF423 family)